MYKNQQICRAKLHQFLAIGFGVLPVLTLGGPWMAQALPLQEQPMAGVDSPVSPQQAGPVPVPRIAPRVMGQFTTGPGLGYESSFGSLYALFPLFQLPGQSLGFTEARLNFTTEDANFGGNIIFGYRQYWPDQDIVYGAYAGYDIRDTGPSTFSQLGGGVEVMGSHWEARLNGYLPIGETRNLISSQSTNQGSSLDRLNFERNLLFATTKSTTQIDKTYESALAGLDLEAGTRLLSWGNGDLRGFVGGYFYDGSGVDAFPGFRSRLAVRQGEALSGGLEFTTDERFGSRFTVTVGIGFGGGRSRGVDRDVDALVARLQSPVQRQPNIVVDEQNERQFVDSFGTDTVANPATGEAWRFAHVRAGSSGGNGTVEQPFGEVTTAVNRTQSDGNDIVYVDAAPNSPLSGFSIPDSVRVMSTGPKQFLPASIANQRSVIQLPGSGSGRLPTVLGSVFMGDQSWLQGFDLRPLPNQPGVVGTDVGNLTIADNRIVTSGDNAAGIRITENRSFTDPGNQIQIVENTISTNGAQSSGIEVFVTSGSISRLEVAGNTVNTDGEFSSHGIRVLVRDTGTLGSLGIDRNDVSTAGPLSEGIFLSSTDAGWIGRATINRNTISTTGSVPSDSANEFDLESDGIYVNVLRSGQLGQIQISDNVVTTLGNDADGIYLIAGVGGVIQQALISNNTVSTTGMNPLQASQSAESIKILAYANGRIENLSLLDNTILQSEGDGILLRARSGVSPEGGEICADLQGNTSLNANVSGQIIGTPYSFSNPDDRGSISLVGADLNAVIASNSPSDPAAFSTTGSIFFVPSCP